MWEMDKYWTNMIIQKNLEETEPLMDLKKEDAKVLQLCINDFWDYVNFINRNFIEVEPEVSEVNGTKVAFDDQRGEIYISFKTSLSIEETEQCIKVFVKAWWFKYKQRIKLSFEELKLNSELLTGKAVMDKNFTSEEIFNITNAVTDHLIKYGEYCCPKIIAESIIPRIIGQFNKTKWILEDKINLISKLKKEAHNIAYTHGTLIFMKVDVKMYGLRDYRDDGSHALPPPSG